MDRKREPKANQDEGLSMNNSVDPSIGLFGAPVGLIAPVAHSADLSERNLPSLPVD